MGGGLGHPTGSGGPGDGPVSVTGSYLPSRAMATGGQRVGSDGALNAGDRVRPPSANAIVQTCHSQGSRTGPPGRDPGASEAPDQRDRRSWTTLPLWVDATGLETISPDYRVSTGMSVLVFPIRRPPFGHGMDLTRAETLPEASSGLSAGSSPMWREETDWAKASTLIAHGHGAAAASPRSVIIVPHQRFVRRQIQRTERIDVGRKPCSRHLRIVV